MAAGFWKYKFGFIRKSEAFGEAVIRTHKKGKSVMATHIGVHKASIFVDGKHIVIDESQVLFAREFT